MATSKPTSLDGRALTAALPRTAAAIDPSAIAAFTVQGTLDRLRDTPEARRAGTGVAVSLALVCLGAPFASACVAAAAGAGAWAWSRRRGDDMVSRAALARDVGVALWSLGPVAAAASLGLCCFRADGTAPLPAAVALVAGCAAAAGAGGDDAFVGPAAAYLAWAWASPTMTWPHRFALLGCVGLRYALGGSRCGGRFGDLFAASFRDALRSATARAARAPLEDLGEDELLQASLLNYVAELWDAPSAGDFNVITAVLEAVAAFGAGAVGASVLALGALERRLVDERFDADDTADWAAGRVEALERAVAPADGVALGCRALADAPHLLVAVALAAAGLAAADRGLLVVALALAPLVFIDLGRLAALRAVVDGKAAAFDAAFMDARAADLAARRSPDSAALAAAADDLRCAALLARDGGGGGLELLAARHLRGGDAAGLLAAFGHLRRIRVALGSRRCRVSLRTLQTSARVKTLAVGVGRLASAGAAAYAAGGDGGTASAVSLSLALVNEARLLLSDRHSATRQVARDAAVVAENAARLWRESGAAEYVDDALFAPENRSFWQWTAAYSGGATAGAVVGGLLAGPLGAAAGAALAGGGVGAAQAGLLEEAPEEAALPALPAPPPPEETDRWSDVDSDDDPVDEAASLAEVARAKAARAEVLRARAARLAAEAEAAEAQAEAEAAAEAAEAQAEAEAAAAASEEAASEEAASEEAASEEAPPPSAEEVAVSPADTDASTAPAPAAAPEVPPEPPLPAEVSVQN